MLCFEKIACYDGARDLSAVDVEAVACEAVHKAANDRVAHTRHTTNIGGRRSLVNDARSRADAFKMLAKRDAIELRKNRRRVSLDKIGDAAAKYAWNARNDELVYLRLNAKIFYKATHAASTCLEHADNWRKWAFGRERK